MNLIFLALILFAWLASLLTLYSRMKDREKTAKAFFDSAMADKDIEISNLTLKIEEERRIEKETAEKKQSIRTGNNGLDVERATAILCNKN